MSDKPKWERWRGEKKSEYEQRLQDWMDDQEATKMTHQTQVARVSVCCSRCRYWLQFGNANQGECFRFPTKIITTPTHWCGEHEWK